MDTVCWTALLNRTETIHHYVDTQYRRVLELGYELVTTTAVLNEAANSLCSPRFRLTAVAFYKQLTISRRVNIVFVDERLWRVGWQLFEQYADKEWSLTDCLSIAVIQERGIMEVLTTDHHFEQAGFVTLLKP